MEKEGSPYILLTGLIEERLHSGAVVKVWLFFNPVSGGGGVLPYIKVFFDINNLAI